MCERYVSPDAASVEREFGLTRAGDRFGANFNVAPLQTVPIVRRADGAKAAAFARWGLVPASARGRAGRYRMFRAPVESLRSRAAYRGPWTAAQRCIVPALGFYVWRGIGHGSRSPYYIHAEDQDVCGFAGLWERSTDDAGAVLESCTIISLPANALLASLRGSAPRMPAILGRDARDAWLSGTAHDATAVLCAYPAERLVAYRVSGRVNVRRNNDENLIEPLATDVD
jgi:putative SOS response-associated peptidase YedK